MEIIMKHIKFLLAALAATFTLSAQSVQAQAQIQNEPCNVYIAEGKTIKQALSSMWSRNKGINGILKITALERIQCSVDTYNDVSYNDVEPGLTRSQAVSILKNEHINSAKHVWQRMNKRSTWGDRRRSIQTMKYHLTQAGVTLENVGLTQANLEILKAKGFQDEAAFHAQNVFDARNSAEAANPKFLKEKIYYMQEQAKAANLANEHGKRAMEFAKEELNSSVQPNS